MTITDNSETITTTVMKISLCIPNIFLSTVNVVFSIKTQNNRTNRNKVQQRKENNCPTSPVQLDGTARHSTIHAEKTALRGMVGYDKAHTRHSSAKDTPAQDLHAGQQRNARHNRI